jgi:putative serine protease PepD
MTRRPRTPTLTLALLAVIAAAAAIVVAAIVAGSDDGSDRAAATPGIASGNPSAASERAVQVALPSVVQIESSGKLGSGVVFDGDGDIVTNAHVVSGSRTFTVITSDGQRHQASLRGSFPASDLAVVRVDDAKLTPAHFADSAKLEVGERVLAIGNPLGLRSSVTDGIVSATSRTVSEGTGVALPSVVQTSAAINPGNSGGALVDLQGKVIGIPTLAATDPELGGTAPGIGFAIPSSLVANIAGQIVAHGHVVNSHRAYLGVDLATGLTSGAVVAGVLRGGPAAKAGIQPGELITSLAGHRVSSPADVTDMLATLKPGQTVSVGLVRPDGSKTTVTVKLGQYPGSLG